jgi:hypothetical protein
MSIKKVIFGISVGYIMFRLLKVVFGAICMLGGILWLVANAPH